VEPKNCTQILKGLNKNNYIRLLAYRACVLWYIILLSIRIEEIFKICALWASLSATTQQVGIASLTASSVLQGIYSSLLRLHTLRLEAAAK